MCTECDRAYKHEHYVANKLYYKAKSKVSYPAAVARYNALKDAPCVDCGVKYPSYVMQFDHVRGKKSFNIGNVKGISLKRLLIEVEKCDLVCANCHAERTHMRL